MDDSEADRVEDVDADSEREMRMEVARRVYDKFRHFIFVPPGMVNQIYRHGILPKKSIDGSGSTRMHGSRNYWRDDRTVTPDGSLVIHRDDLDPCPGHCTAFIHPPYGSSQEYRGENDRAYSASVSLAQLAGASHNCGFCAMLYQGIMQNRDHWLRNWAFQLKSNDMAEEMRLQQEQLWHKIFQEASQTDNGVQADELGINLVFPKGGRERFTAYIFVRDMSSKSQEPSVDQPKTTADIYHTMREAGSRSRIAELEFYTALSQKSPWAAFHPAPHVQPWMLSAACLVRIFGWLRPCVLWHKACRQSPWNGPPSVMSPRVFEMSKSERTKSSRSVGNIDHLDTKSTAQSEEATHDLEHDDGFPRRLLRLAPTTENSDLPFVQLIETTEENGVYRYIALSHVWSLTTPLKTTRENYAFHKAQVPWTGLSLALRDVILLTLKLELGIDYLWVDSLCIIQNDLIDKASELPRMSLIYGRAEIVFAMHGAQLMMRKRPCEPIRDPFHPEKNTSPFIDDVDEKTKEKMGEEGPTVEGAEVAGLDRERMYPKLTDPPVYCRPRIDHCALFSHSQGTSPWLGRAWCMQERIFAPRILHFGGYEGEISFECNTLVDCECGNINIGRVRRGKKDDGLSNNAKRGDDSDIVTTQSASRSQSGSPVQHHDPPTTELLTMKGEIANTLLRIQRRASSLAHPDGGVRSSNLSESNSTALRNDCWAAYISICEDYTPRGLTFASDKLNAVSSLMRTFAPYLGTYYAGLFEHNLLLSLQWEAFDTQRCRRPPDGQLIAPTFSWASVQGGVVWYFDPAKLAEEFWKGESHESATIQQIAVGGSSITICGRTTRMYVVQGKEQSMPDGKVEMVRSGQNDMATTECTGVSQGPNDTGSRKHRNEEERCFVVFDTQDDYDAAQAEGGTEVVCLNIMQDVDGLHRDFVSALVLRAVRDARGGTEDEAVKADGAPVRRYTRIGFSTMKAAHFSKSAYEIVEIV